MANLASQNKSVADKNPQYATDPGRDTQDRVRLLSMKEASELFVSSDARTCFATEYALAQANSYPEGEPYWWWLRTPGYYQYRAANVRETGKVYGGGADVNDAKGLVRPVITVLLTGN